MPQVRSGVHTARIGNREPDRMRKTGLITLKINGLDVSVEKGATLLEAAKFLGFPIPTLCYMEGLSPYGACRLCVVEIGEGPKPKLVSSCTYPDE